MKKLSLKASCLCGNIQLRTQGYHRDIHNCHCIQCMKTHGHHAAYTAVKLENIKFLKKKHWNGLSLLKEQKEVFVTSVEQVCFLK